VGLLQNLTITNGDTAYGGGGFNSGAVLFIENSEIVGNRARLDGGAFHNHGGLIVIEGSTIAENLAGSDAVLSMAITEAEPGKVGFWNSTISGNTSTDAFSRVLGPSTLMNCTVAGNQTGPFGFILEGDGSRSQHTIFAANDSPACNAGFSSIGHNLADSDGCIFPNASYRGDQVVPDAFLGPLANNGGPTRTHAILPGSPAIDAGDNDGAPNQDQRGVHRPHDGDGDAQAVTDVGAFEFGGVPGEIFTDDFESGNTSAWSTVVP